jgi:hypothetical protein
VLKHVHLTEHCQILAGTGKGTQGRSHGQLYVPPRRHNG